MGLAAFNLLPLGIVTLFLIPVGIILGVIKGMAALRLAKDALPQENERVITYACLGIVLSLAQLGYLAYFLLSST